jgi:hypothetical protein
MPLKGTQKETPFIGDFARILAYRPLGFSDRVSQQVPKPGFPVSATISAPNHAVVTATLHPAPAAGGFVSTYARQLARALLIV